MLFSTPRGIVESSNVCITSHSPYFSWPNAKWQLVEWRTKRECKPIDGRKWWKKQLKLNTKTVCLTWVPVRCGWRWAVRDEQWMCLGRCSMVSRFLVLFLLITNEQRSDPNQKWKRRSSRASVINELAVVVVIDRRWFLHAYIPSGNFSFAGAFFYVFFLFTSISFVSIINGSQ